MIFFFGVIAGIGLTLIVGVIVSSCGPAAPRCVACLNTGDRCQLDDGHTGPHHSVFRGYGPMGLGQYFYWPNHE
jgi:hypothetical protein